MTNEYCDIKSDDLPTNANINDILDCDITDLFFIFKNICGNVCIDHNIIDIHTSLAFVSIPKGFNISIRIIIIHIIVKHIKQCTFFLSDTL